MYFESHFPLQSTDMCTML